MKEELKMQIIRLRIDGLINIYRVAKPTILE